MQPQQPDSIAHLTENLALSIKNTTDRSIDYRSVPRKMTSHPNVIKATPRQINMYLNKYNQPVAVTASPLLHR
jgi:hypothetical protein